MRTKRSTWFEKPRIGTMMPELQRFPADPESAKNARRFVSAAVVSAGIEDCGVAELLTSELVTNSVLHCGSSVVVAVHSLDDCMRIEVIDGCDQLPELKSPSVQDDTGRGLMIVDVLADRWGVVMHDYGKAIWFTLRLERPIMTRT
jgi:anti-sigma regulatory factor (Ser/Thr protein kinase)